jgi:type III pantothenate kinase
MNLIIDIGNSFVKVAVFKKDALVQKELIQSKDLLKTVKELKKKYKTLNKAIISSVGKVETTIIDVLKESFHVLVLNSQTKLPFKNLYGTPKTLGVDRMALVSASTKQFPKKNVLIVDAGTCITYDFINNKNEYFGGAISPGIRMRYQSLNNFTANLPLLETNLPTDIIGNSTATSIHSGINNNRHFKRN